MWLHLPTSVCSREPEDLIFPSDSLCQMLAASASWRGKSLRPQSWRRVCETAPSTKLLSGLTCEPSTAQDGVASWMESLAASRARISPSLENSKVSTESTVACSSSTSGSFARFNQDGSISRMSPQYSLFPQEEPYLENLPNSGSMRSGQLSERPTLALPTSGNGRSFWPTARSEDSESCGNHPGATDSLTGATRNWPTPYGMTGIDHTGKAGAGGEFAKAVEHWPTPNAHDGRRPGSDETSTQGANLKRDAEQWATPQSHDAAGGSPARVGRFGTEHGGRNLADDVTLWMTPDVPNGGRTMNPAAVAAKGQTDGRKRQVGLENQVGIWGTPTSNERTFEPRNVDHGIQLANQACHSFLPAPETQMPGSEPSPSAPTSRRRMPASQSAIAISSSNSEKTVGLLKGRLEDPSERESAAFSLFLSLAVTYTKRRLNPNFVDWLMGWPIGQTGYEQVEMASWLSKAQSLLENLPKGLA